VTAGVDEQPLDLGEATVAGMAERGHTAVGEIGIGTGGEQQADDLRLGGATVAEDDGFEERRPGEPVDVVDVDVGRQQLTVVPAPVIGPGESAAGAGGT
jgi:hypothetical protein